MKKNYIQPQVKEIKIAPNYLLAGSLGLNDDNAENPGDKNNNLSKSDILDDWDI